MSLLTDVNTRITQAMKAHDSLTLSAMRMLKTALTNREVERGHPLDETESLQVVAGLVKQRRESIEAFEKGGRQDLVEKERAELALLEPLLPPPLSAAEVETVVAAVIAETGATSPRDMGRVMKAAMTALAGKGADGKTVNEIVRRKLAG